MAEQFYEIYSNFSPIFNTANALLRERGYNEICETIADSQISVINTEYDNWNGGTYGYTVYINLPVKKYSTLSSEKIGEVEKIFAEFLNEVSGIDNCYFHAKITPVLSRVDMDWDIIGGSKGKTILKQKIETIKSVMISVATNGSLIKDEEERYLKLQAEIINDCKKLNLIYNNFTRVYGIGEENGKPTLKHIKSVEITSMNFFCQHLHILKKWNPYKIWTHWLN